MDYQNEHVLTLANSIIGVGVLAMPYCFKQCGILLSIIMLLISSIISRLSCHFLLKSAISSRRKTFEILAFHIFGTMGKLIIEIGIIGFLLGTCIAFFVVMGDLTPEIICQITGLNKNEALRTCILLALALFCVLPLGLLRNIDSLCGVSKATIGFYGCLIIKIIADALPHLFTGDWFSKVTWWRPSGILQCIPIFSMALFCQTQLFEMYQILPNLSLEKLNNLVRVAVTICTWVYIFVGSFGYIAFFGKPFSGNILLSFSPSNVTDLIKIGFVFSVAFSFPLVIFPCRASLHSLFYRKECSLHEGSASNYIPETRFKMLTFLIVFTSLIIGILIPNIELVLGLIGSTIGVMICVLFPATCFICITEKNTNEKLLAQIILLVGGIVMVLGTFENMSAYQRNIDFEMPPKQKEFAPLNSINLIQKPQIMNKIEEKEEDDNFQPLQVSEKILQPNPIEKNAINQIIPEKQIIEPVKEIRHEPLQPIEIDQVTEKKIESKEKIVTNITSNLKAGIPEKLFKNNNLNALETIVNSSKETIINSQLNPISNESIVKTSLSKEVNPLKIEAVNVKPKTNEDVDIEAIKKEETELKAQEEEVKKEEDLKKQVTNEDEKKILDNNSLLQSLNKQNEVQKQLLVEQNKLLKEALKDHQNMDKQKMKEDDKILLEKMRAVQQIENIAIQAIESISGKKTDNKQENEILDKVAENKINNIVNNTSLLKEKIKKTIVQNPDMHQQSLLKYMKNINVDKLSESNLKEKTQMLKNLTKVKQNKERSKILALNNTINPSKNIQDNKKASIVNLLARNNSNNNRINSKNNRVNLINDAKKNGTKGERI